MTAAAALLPTALSTWKGGPTNQASPSWGSPPAVLGADDTLQDIWQSGARCWAWHTPSSAGPSPIVALARASMDPSAPMLQSVAANAAHAATHAGLRSADACMQPPTLKVLERRHGVCLDQARQLGHLGRGRLHKHNVLRLGAHGLERLVGVALHSEKTDKKEHPAPRCI